MALTIKTPQRRSVTSASTGFTLIEILMVLIILSVLLGLAAPSVAQFLRSSELTSSANNLLAAINTARAEAMRANRNTYLIPTDGTDWTKGWTVYSDTNFDQKLDAAVDNLVLRTDALPTSVTVTITGSGNSFSSGYVMFNGSGYPRLNSGSFGAGTIELGNGTESRNVILDAVGRVRVCKKGTTGC